MGVINNLIKGKLHPVTGEDLKPSTTTTWQDGSVITDAHCGGLYNKDTQPGSSTFNQYFKWNAAGAWPVSRLTTVNLANFKKLISDFGDTPATILIDRTIILSESLIIPKNIKIDFYPGALFNISAGATVTINSAINEGNQHLFSGSGNAFLPANSKINPCWFGMSEAQAEVGYYLTKSFAAGSFVQIPKGVYNLAADISVPEGVTLKGRNRNSNINFTTEEANIKPQGKNVIREISFTGIATRAISIVGSNAKNDIEISDNYFNGQSIGVYVDRGVNVVCYNIRVNNNQFQSMRNDAILCVTVNDSEFCNNYIRGTLNKNIEFFGGKRNLIQGNNIETGVTGISFIFQWTTARAQGQVDGNKIIGNTIRNISEESISFDVRGNIADDMATRERSTVARKTASGGFNFIHLSHTELWNSNKPYIGACMCFFTGKLKGQVFEILDYGSPSPDVRFNMRITADVMSEVEAGDVVIIGAPFTNNIIQGNNIVMPHGPLTTGIFLYGLCYYNLVDSNIVRCLSSDSGKPGIRVRSLGGLNKTNSLTNPPGGRDAPSENNTLSNNLLINCDEVSDYYGYGSATPYHSVGNRHVGVNTTGSILINRNDNLVYSSKTHKGVVQTNAVDVPEEGLVYLTRTGSGNGTTTVSIPHNLGKVPSYIGIPTPLNAESAGVTYVTRDAVNINVHFGLNTVVGVDNLLFNIALKK
jgi:hypothetical protein